MDKKKEQLPQVAPKDETLIRTMPEKYVGVSLKATLQGVRQGIGSEPSAPPVASRIPPPQTLKSPIITAPPQKKSPPTLVIFGGVIILLIGVALAVFFIPRKQPTPPVVNTPAPVVVMPPVNVAPPVSVATTTPPEFSGPIRNAADSDADGLTDREEQEIYKTDPTNPDADHDGYLDGSEVFYLYNPAAVAPTTLLASGIVRQSDNPANGFSVYTPTVWVVTENATGLTATGQTGEFVQIISQTIPLQMTLMDWYLQANPSVDKTSVMIFVNRAGLTGIKAADGLTAYFVANDRVYTVAYMSAERKELSYRRTFEMMVNSFKTVSLGGTEQASQQTETTSTPSVVNEVTTSTPSVATSTPVVVTSTPPVTTSTPKIVPEANANATSSSKTTSTTP